MPFAPAARASALPRSLALSSLSHLTLVVLWLLVRALVPHAPAPAEGGIEISWPPPLGPIPVDPKSDAARLVPPAPPAAPDDGPVVPVDHPAAIRDSVAPVSAPTLPDLAGSAGPGGAGGGVGGGQGGGAAPAVDPDPPYGRYVWVEQLPELVTRVQPQYPSIAQQAGLEGTVLLALQVGADGRVRRVKVLESNVMFDSAAVDAARRWVFTPATTDGHAVPVWVEQRVKFVLHE